MDKMQLLYMNVLNFTTYVSLMHKFREASGETSALFAVGKNMTDLHTGYPIVIISERGVAPFLGRLYLT